MFYCNFNNKILEGNPYMADDSSIIFKYAKDYNDLILDYTVSLGGNPRYLIDLFHKTGKCGPLRCFMTGAKVIEKELEIPQSRKGELYFIADEDMTPYSGSMFLLFDDICHYDKVNNILCFGNPHQEGETIEFATNTYAVVKQNELVAVFMKVDYLKEYVEIRRGMFYQRLL